MRCLVECFIAFAVRQQCNSAFSSRKRRFDDLQKQGRVKSGIRYLINHNACKRLIIFMATSLTEGSNSAKPGASILKLCPALTPTKLPAFAPNPIGSCSRVSRRPLALSGACTQRDRRGVRREALPMLAIHARARGNVTQHVTQHVTRQA
jgi:hypothetical protein